MRTIQERKKREKGKLLWPAILQHYPKNDLELVDSFTHLNYAAVGRVESSRGLGTIHQTPKIRVSDNGLNGILDRRMMLFSLASLKKRVMR